MLRVCDTMGFDLSLFQKSTQQKEGVNACDSVFLYDLKKGVMALNI